MVDADLYMDHFIIVAYLKQCKHCLEGKFQVTMEERFALGIVTQEEVTCTSQRQSGPL